MPAEPTVEHDVQSDADAVHDLLAREGIDDATIAGRIAAGDTEYRVRCAIAVAYQVRRPRNRRGLILSILRGDNHHG